MGIAKITRNCQITLPKDVRKVQGLKEGDSVLFSVEGDKVVITKMKDDVFAAAAGIWKNTKETGAAYQRRIRAQWKTRQQAVNW
ncbi:MAG TPA: AbrB/MazE/SpoVT family DNA-binding domain-containing protein [Candidatus Nanoarchaeia archaeon]|nr:AbrB/MazE/SpoVT family DNA-binding domain-containing protein [Candidatus Nanoarchaeia archaeon]